jgi:DNA mismatch repair ATPase MutS
MRKFLSLLSRQKGVYMPTLQAFFDAGKTILSFGVSLNATNRQEICEVVGQIADELDRALVLADSYLVGARYSRDNQELIQYLQNAHGKLMSSFYEHQVCAGLYHLADKFAQVFDPTRYAISIASYHQIPELINHLKNGERAVLDDLDEVVRQLQDQAYLLSTAAIDQSEAIKNDIFNALQTHRRELEKHRKKIKTLRRKIVDTL